MTAEKDEAEHNKEMYAIIGELVLIANALDTVLNSVVVQVLHLGSSPMIEPVVGTLDPVRKMEILRERAPFIRSRNDEWKKRVTAFVSKAESVFRHRNIACHMPAMLEDGKWALTPVSAAKLLKHLDLDRPKAKRFSFDDLKTAISTGESALAEGVGLVENFKRVNAELEKKRAAPVRREMVEAPVSPEPLAPREIPRSQFPRIRTLVRYGMKVAQVAEVYGAALGDIERIIRRA
jgi:hypothetical protein